MNTRKPKNILEIYEDYRIMPMLQRHQLRVASVAHFICDHINLQYKKTEPKVNTDDVVTACLLHDMGNIIKFDLTYYPEANTENGKNLEYWLFVQKEFKEKYGTDEHHASLTIAKELGQSNRICELIDAVEFRKFEQNEASKDLEIKICAYVDMRVSPHGFVSIEDRLKDGAKRYANHINKVSDEVREKKYLLLQSMEKQIFSDLKINPGNIHDGSMCGIVEILKTSEI